MVSTEPPRREIQTMLCTPTRVSSASRPPKPSNSFPRKPSMGPRMKTRRSEPRREGVAPPSAEPPPERRPPPLHEPAAGESQGSAEGGPVDRRTCRMVCRQGPELVQVPAGAKLPFDDRRFGGPRVRLLAGDAMAI